MTKCRRHAMFIEIGYRSGELFGAKEIVNISFAPNVINSFDARL